MRSIHDRRLPGVLLTALSLLAHPAAAGVDRWTPVGPEGGEIWSLAADASAPGTLYAGTFGGVWKSLDGGGSWGPTPEGLDTAVITSLAASAGRVYAGSYQSLHVLADGAATWRPTGPSFYSVVELVVDPAHPDWVWTHGEYSFDGVLLSEDGGEHWRSKLTLADSFRSIAIMPTEPHTVYAAGYEGIFASTDSGTIWRQLDPGFATRWNTFDLTADATDAGTLYASSIFSGFWKTVDAGEHWSYTADIAPSRLLALPGVLLGAGGDGVLRSEDGGSTWESIALPSRDVTSLAADPADPSGAWISLRGESLLHTSDGGRTWEPSGRRGLRASDIRTFAFDPFRRFNLYAVTLAGGLQKTVDGGASWSRLRPSPYIRSLAADPRRPGTLYAGTLRGVAVSRDRGAHWQLAVRDPAGILAVAADPHRPGTVWAGGYRLWRSQDSGLTWKRVPDPIVSNVGPSIRRIYPSPWHPGTLYLIDFQYDFDDISGPVSLWRSTDDGSTWEAIDENEPVALAFDPATPDLLYVASVSGIIRRSRDGGTTWEPVAASAGGGARLTSLLVDRLDPAILYAATTGGGVWRSRDRGATWEPFSTGLFASVVTCLEADPREPRHLIACTQGGGLLEIRISSGS